MSGKWKISLIWCIHSGISRPGELQRKIGKASRRFLDTQLSQLVQHGVLTKTIFDQRPAKVEYELTSLGESLIPVIELTTKWGEAHRDVLEPLFTIEQFVS